MLMAYLTTDEVNRDLAETLSETCGLRLYLLTTRELPLEGQFDAVLYDWDYLPDLERQLLDSQGGLAADGLRQPAADY